MHGGSILYLGTWRQMSKHESNIPMLYFVILVDWSKRIFNELYSFWGPQNPRETTYICCRNLDMQISRCASHLFQSTQTKLPYLVKTSCEARETRNFLEISSPNSDENHLKYTQISIYECPHVSQKLGHNL